MPYNQAKHPPLSSAGGRQKSRTGKGAISSFRPLGGPSSSQLGLLIGQVSKDLREIVKALDGRNKIAIADSDRGSSTHLTLMPRAH